jgi:hypothetical protein
VGDDFIKCPFCQHELKVSCGRCGTLQQEGWTSCPKCGFNQEEMAYELECSSCGAEVLGEWRNCPYCQTPRNGKAPVAAAPVESESRTTTQVPDEVAATLAQLEAAAPKAAVSQAPTEEQEKEDEEAAKARALKAQADAEYDAQYAERQALLQQLLEEEESTPKRSSSGLKGLLDTQEMQAYKDESDNEPLQSSPPQQDQRTTSQSVLQQLLDEPDSQPKPNKGQPAA